MLGLTGDLLPVVSNPKAIKSPESKIQGPGKTPSVYNTNGQMAGFAKWTQHASTPRDIWRWMKESDYGICIQTRVVRAIDVDVDDPEEAGQIAVFIEERLNRELPCRARSNAAKFLLAFEMPGDFTKRRFKTHKGVIEFLATGQQFVAIGTHPSGVHYEWIGGLPNDIPIIEAEEFEALWSALNEKFGTEESVEMRSGVAPGKRRHIDDTSDPVVAYLDEHWTTYGQDKSGRVDIECPFAEEHTSDSGESATSYFPAGVGGFEKGHFKCQHSHCAHRTDMDFLGAVGYATHGFEVIEQPTPQVDAVSGVVVEDANDDYAGKIYPWRIVGGKKDGKVTVCRESLFVGLSHPRVCGTKLGYDAFRDEIMIRDGKVMRNIRDRDYYQIGIHLERGFGGQGGFEKILLSELREAVSFAADENAFDSATQWVSSLRWDGISRIDTFLRDFMGAEDTPYTRSVSRYFWTALAGRALSPGVKADMAPIAVGDQGTGKTTLLSVIVPHHDMFLELDLGKGDDTLARELRGKLLCELGEMKGMNDKRREHLKSFMSRQRELWVPKYKEFTTSYPRRCVFFGTTNDNEPLPEDESGQRRWLPFKVASGFKCDTDAFIALRDQYWAEAAVAFNAGGIAWNEAEKLAKPEHFAFEKDDSWLEHLRTWLYSSAMGEPAPIEREDGLPMIEVLTSGLNLAVRDITITAERRAGKCLRQLGFTRVVRHGKKSWVPPVGELALTTPKP